MRNTPRAARYAESHPEAPVQPEAPAIVQPDAPADPWAEGNTAERASPESFVQSLVNAYRDPHNPDRAFPVLYAEPTLNDRQREQLWTIFHSSRNVTELAANLQQLELHPDLRKNLLRAKDQTTNLERAVQAVNHMATMDPRALALAEQHPAVLKAALNLETE